MQSILSRVLVLEDNPLIAMDQEAMLRKLSVEKILLATTVADAETLLDDNQVEFALLDVELGGETSEPIAKRLQASEVPFVFVSGYADGAGLGSAFADAPALVKPLSEGALRDTLRGLGLLDSARHG